MAFATFFHYEIIFTEIPHDSNFKSIHQLQSEEHAKDTIKSTNENLKDTTYEMQSKNSGGILNSKESMKSIIRLSLIIILIAVMIAAIAIFLIERRIYRTKK